MTIEAHRLRLVAGCPRLPGAPVARGAVAREAQLWTAARQRASVAAGLIPGLVEVVEKIGPCPLRGEIAVYFATRLDPDSRGEPTARVIDSLGHRRETALEAPVRHAHGLLERLDAALAAGDPLTAATAGVVQRAQQRVVDGTRCIGFHTARRTAGLDLEFSLWIDAALGRTLRMDFRGLNLRDTAAENRIASVYGVRRYAADAAGRWILRTQSDRLTFLAEEPEVPPTGYVERLTSYAEYWERPAGVPAPVDARVETAGLAVRAS